MKKIKITLPAEYKQHYTINEVEQMKKVIDLYNKEMPETVGDAVQVLENMVKGKAIEAKAETAGNCRIYNHHDTDSGKIDIYITATIQAYDAFYIIGAYITDIWNITGDNNDEIKKQMFIREFKETR